MNSRGLQTSGPWRTANVGSWEVSLSTDRRAPRADGSGGPVPSSSPQDTLRTSPVWPGLSVPVASFCFRTGSRGRSLQGLRHRASWGRGGVPGWRQVTLASPGTSVGAGLTGLSGHDRGLLPLLTRSRVPPRGARQGVWVRQGLGPRALTRVMVTCPVPFYFVNTELVHYKSSSERKNSTKEARSPGSVREAPANRPPGREALLLPSRRVSRPPARVPAPAHVRHGSPLTCPEILELRLFHEWGQVVKGSQRECGGGGSSPAWACVRPSVGSQFSGPDDFIKRCHVPVRVQSALRPWLPTALASSTPTEAR